ncbi:MAG: RNA polymerase sigma factor [Candidatus Promineifilaceae bacterium]
MNEAQLSADASLAPADRTQHELISRCLAGEESAYHTVYNQYSGRIYRLCYSLLQNREDAEEVLQDSFEYAFRRLSRFDPSKASFGTWLYQIAVSRSRNKRRRKWLPTISLSSLLTEQVADDSKNTPPEQLILNEQQLRVWNALGQLSMKLRETAVLRYYEGLTYAEIGKILSIPPKTAESRMRLAHNALRNLLADQLDDEGVQEGK